MAQVLRLLRLGKVLRLKESLLTSRMGVSFRMSRMFIFIILLMHWTACAWRVASIETVRRLPSNASQTYVDPVEDYLHETEANVQSGAYDPWKVSTASRNAELIARTRPRT